MTLADYVADKVKGHRTPLAYDLFSELVMFATPLFKFVSNDEASKAVIAELQQLGMDVGTQETNLHRKWPAQETAVPFGKGNPGGLYNPISSLETVSSELAVGDRVRYRHQSREWFEGTVADYCGLRGGLKYFFVNFDDKRVGRICVPEPSLIKLESTTSSLGFTAGDYVSVDKDTWRPAFEGTIEKIDGESVDVRDFETRDLQEDIPLKLVKRPLAKGRPIAPPQHRRVGDPLGPMDSLRDSGDPNTVREYPGVFHLPKGQEGKSVNPPDLLYSNLIDTIDEKHGKISLIVAKYLRGEAINPSGNLLSVLEAYGITRAV